MADTGGGGFRRSSYLCGKCGHATRLWSARCPKCASWGMNPVNPDDIPPPAPAPEPAPVPELDDEDEDLGTAPVALCDIEEQRVPRERTGFEQIDGVLGGGLVKGSVILFGASPGSGKSTLTLQIADRMALPTLYVTGEESIAQVGDRAHRIDSASNRVSVIAETNLRRILKQALRSKAEFLIIDSIQTLTHPTIQGNARSPSQVAGCAKILFDFAKLHGVSVWTICHVTGDGGLAGTMTLQHFADVLLFMDTVKVIKRVVKCLAKNRFGSVAAVAHLEMTDRGLIECKPPEPDFEANPDSPFAHEDNGNHN